MRCRPGDLAFVVNDLEVPKNNGAIVKVLRRVDPADYFLPVDWECEAVSRIYSFTRVASPGDSDFAYRDIELLPFPKEQTENETFSSNPLAEVL